MNKKLISCLCILVFILTIPATAFASGESDIFNLLKTRSDPANFSFSLQRGAASSSTDRAYKDDYTAAEVYPQDGTVSEDDNVAFRVRNAQRESATGLYVREDLEDFSMWYYSGEGEPGYKYLYANAPSYNESQWVSVSGIWYP